MDLHRLRKARRAAFWVGFRSIWDITGERTARELRALACEEFARSRPPYKPLSVIHGTTAPQPWSWNYHRP